MWTSLDPVKLIRYLLIWRANSPLVQLPAYLPVELSRALGAMIAGRLPTREAASWRKALGQWGEDAVDDKRRRDALPEALWPIEAALLAYPGKRAIGQGEPILWELKLFGESADHGLFLETILPAMEQAGYTSDHRWKAHNRLWGRFDIQAVYVARGPRWEPLVSDTRLNLRYRPNATQWAEGLAFGTDLDRVVRSLTWLTPFDLEGVFAAEDGPHPAPLPKGIPPGSVPTLGTVLRALTSRLGLLLRGEKIAPEDVWGILGHGEGPCLQEAIQMADSHPICFADLKSVPVRWPGGWRGMQTFEPLPEVLLPYLELASILHIGRQTHFGCGTFVLE